MPLNDGMDLRPGTLMKIDLAEQKAAAGLPHISEIAGDDPIDIDIAFVAHVEISKLPITRAPFARAGSLGVIAVRAVSNA